MMILGKDLQGYTKTNLNIKQVVQGETCTCLQ